MATFPQYAATPKVGMAAISTANTNRDGTGTLGTVFTAGASGSRIDNIDVVGVANTAAGIVNLFLYDGSTAHRITGVNLMGVTAGTTASPEEYHLGVYSNPLLFPIIHQTGWTIRASVTTALWILDRRNILAIIEKFYQFSSIPTRGRRD